MVIKEVCLLAAGSKASFTAAICEISFGAHRFLLLFVQRAQLVSAWFSVDHLLMLMIIEAKTMQQVLVG